MNEFAESGTAHLDSLIPGYVAPLSSVLFTEELYRRPSRPRDYAKESRAFIALAQALAESPRTIRLRHDWFRTSDI
jgi:hypothetical protein